MFGKSFCLSFPSMRCRCYVYVQGEIQYLHLVRQGRGGVYTPITDFNIVSNPIMDPITGFDQWCERGASAGPKTWYVRPMPMGHCQCLITYTSLFPSSFPYHHLLACEILFALFYPMFHSVSSALYSVLYSALRCFVALCTVRGAPQLHIRSLVQFVETVSSKF